MSIQFERSGILHGDHGFLRSGLPFLIILIVAPLPAFWYGVTMLGDAWSLPEFRLKALVPALSLLMVLETMRFVTPGPVAPWERWPGVLIIACALLLALLGNAALVSHFVYSAIVLYVAGVIVLLVGLRASLSFSAPVACLLLMLPIPMFLYRVVHGFLLELTMQIATPLLSAVGATALVDGDYLHLGGLSIRLQSANSGLANFLPVMLIFFFFATFYRGPLWLRILPLVLAGPLLILLSAARLVALGLVANRQGASAAETFLDLSGGWPFLALASALLFGLVFLAAWLSGARRSLERRLRFDLPGMVRQVGRAASIDRSAPLATAALLSILAGAAVLAAPNWPSTVIERESLSRFPPEIGGWSGSKSGLSARVEETLAATDHLSVDFVHSDEAYPVNLWVAYYLAQEPTQRVHSPEACLPGAGWNFMSRDIVTLSLPGPEAVELPVNRAVIRHGDAMALMYYWYEGRGRRTANDVVARMEYLLDDLTIGRSDGALVRFVTAIGPDETEAHADARLQRLVTLIEGQLARFVPQ